MPELAVRAATVADVAAIADVCNAETQALYGEADADAVTITGWFELPDIAMFVVELDGRVVGYADVQDEEGTRFPVDVRVHPEAAGAGVAEALVGAVEDWSAERGGGSGAQVRAFVAERDEEYRDLLERRGYELVRHSFRMEIELAVAPDEPAWPEGVGVRTFDPERDARAVHEAVQEAFADNWEFHPVSFEQWERFRTSDARFDPELWWLVEDDERLAAASLNAWHFSGDPTFGWVGMLAVRRPWRRRGLGLALLRHSFRDFAARGATRVGLGVDAENTTGAVRLYERAGMHAVQRHDNWFRTL